MSPTAVFLDRDGTINTEEDFLGDPGCVRLEAAAAAGLRMLQDAGFLLVVISNQSGVARGLFDEEAVRRVNEKLAELLAKEGVSIARFYHCPHHPAGNIPRYAADCTCRKPAPGMLLAAAGDFDIDLETSYTVGDRPRDLEAGRKAGTKAVLVRTGYGSYAEEEVLEMKMSDYVADGMADAAAWIIADAGGKGGGAVQH